jgi:hypothetical protein
VGVLFQELPQATICIQSAINQLMFDKQALQWLNYYTRGAHLCNENHECQKIASCRLPYPSTKQANKQHDHCERQERKYYVRALLQLKIMPFKLYYMFFIHIAIRFNTWPIVGFKKHRTFALWFFHNSIRFKVNKVG